MVGIKPIRQEPREVVNVYRKLDGAIVAYYHRQEFVLGYNWGRTNVPDALVAKLKEKGRRVELVSRVSPENGTILGKLALEATIFDDFFSKGITVSHA